MADSLVVLHGSAGFVDELIIVGVALVVLFVAIRLSARSTAEEGEDAELDVADGLEDPAPSGLAAEPGGVEPPAGSTSTESTAPHTSDAAGAKRSASRISGS